MMDISLHELVLMVLWDVGFIAIGGAAALIFFLIFAQSIPGSKTIHSQLDMLLQQGRDKIAFRANSPTSGRRERKQALKKADAFQRSESV